MIERNDFERSTLTFVALAAALVVIAAVVPMFVTARPAREIPAPNVDGNLSGPNAEAWSDVPSADVPLSAAPSGVPNAETVSVRSVDVQAARSDGQLYVRLKWHDSKASRSASDPRSFADAVALQMPVDGSAQPAIAMGSQSNLVNVWYWNADAGTEELLAGGPGSTTRLDSSGLQTWAAHTGSGEDAAWSVVFSRSVDSDVDNRTAITDERDLDVAFAVWDGSNAERSGQKAVSQWYYLPFGPGPGGAPFASLLWVVAGLAIVAVILVTAQGIRRVRSEGGE